MLDGKCTRRADAAARRVAGLALDGRARVGQDAGGGRMGAATGGRQGCAAGLADRAGGRDAGGRARGDGRRRFRYLPDRLEETGQSSRHRGGGWSGRTVRWRRYSPPRTRRACADRSSTIAWCDELAQMETCGRKPGTCCSSALQARRGIRAQLVTTTPRPVPVLKALIADPGTAIVRNSHQRQCAKTWRRASLDAMAGPLRRHAARAAGTRRRDDRGPRGRALVARRASRP